MTPTLPSHRGFGDVLQLFYTMERDLLDKMEISKIFYVGELARNSGGNTLGNLFELR